MMDIIKLALENMTEDEVRAKLREFDFELPLVLILGSMSRFPLMLSWGVLWL